MSLNVGLSASARIELLDCLLRHDRWWTKEELLQEVCNYTRALKDKDVSDATLRNDLEEIRIKAGDHFLEEKKGKKKAFRYDDRTFSIYSIQRPDPEDYDNMQQAIRLLEQVKGLGLSDDLKAMLVKLKYVLPVQDNRPLVLFDGPERFDGMDLMQQIYDAISKEQVIAFHYQPFSEKEKLEFILHPYLLKEYNNRWFLVGMAEPKREIYICALDRFKGDPKPRPRIAFVPPAVAGFDAYAYFADVIGPTVRKENPVEEVRLKFSPARTPYVLTKPLHNSQRLIKSYANGGAVLAYDLRFNKELLGLIMGFGSDVEVVQPLTLRNKVKEMVEDIVKIYG